jgi:hypothetical protein
MTNFPQAGFIQIPTPIERLKRLSKTLEIDLFVKRDDLAGPSFGGNKTRQLDYYLGAAVEQKCDTVLITGAVQSNFVRTAAALAAKLGMRTIVQLEARVPEQDQLYQTSGNVLLNQLLGAEVIYYSDGEDEAGADAALRERAEQERANERQPCAIDIRGDSVFFRFWHVISKAIKFLRPHWVFVRLLEIEQPRVEDFLGGDCGVIGFNDLGVCVQAANDLQRGVDFLGPGIIHLVQDHHICKFDLVCQQVHEGAFVFFAHGLAPFMKKIMRGKVVQQVYRINHGDHRVEPGHIRQAVAKFIAEIKGCSDGQGF